MDKSTGSKNQTRIASAKGRVKPLTRLLRCATAVRVTAPLLRHDLAASSNNPQRLQEVISFMRRLVRVSALSISAPER